jgi:hypothetical protein
MTWREIWKARAAMRALVVMSIMGSLMISNLPAMADPGKPDDVSPANAELLSVAGTLASYTTAYIGFEARNFDVFAAGVASMVVLPSAGRWYAHSSAWDGMTVRGLGVGVAAVGLISAIQGDGVGTLIFLGAGAALMAGGTIYDLYRAPLDAAEHNSPLKNIQITPTVQPQHHSNGFGLSIRAQF